MHTLREVVREFRVFCLSLPWLCFVPCLELRMNCAITLSCYVKCDVKEAAQDVMSTAHRAHSENVLGTIAFGCLRSNLY